MNLTTTVTSQAGMYGFPEIVDAVVTETRIEITKKANPNFTYTIMGPGSQPPSQVWKEVWEVQDGKLVRLEDIQGQHHPAFFNQEEITWPDSL